MRGRKTKYGNRKVTVDGHTFDSKREAKRYSELKLLEGAGEIKDLQLQVKFLLIPAQYESFERYSEKSGKRLKDGSRCIEREVAYYADFVYIDKDGNRVVEDTKGEKTTDYIIKRKLLLYVHGIRINEI